MGLRTILKIQQCGGRTMFVPCAEADFSFVSVAIQQRIFEDENDHFNDAAFLVHELWN